MNSIDEDNEVKVVLEQTLLRTEEVFVYRIPPMMTAGGHHADDWDLANPVATCSLHVLRSDSTLFIKLLTDKPKLNGPPGATEKHLFAQSKITLDLSSNAKTKLTIGHWIEIVTDSSRYFVIRISDEQRNKEAHIGIGFRERNDALNFKMSLQEYENTMRKEAMVNDNFNEDINQSYDATGTASSDGGEGIADSQDYGMDTTETLSKLTLKEGEKIHINLKGASSSRNRAKKSSLEHSPSSEKPPKLLKIPPPPSMAMDSDPVVVVNTDALSKSRDAIPHNFDACISSVAAVAENHEIGEEEWGDFESSSFDTSS